MGRVLVVQATDLLRRGVLATPPDVATPDGEPANALYSTIKALRRALSPRAPALAVAVLDRQAHPSWDPLASAQLSQMEPILTAHGFVVERCDEPTRRAARWVGAASLAGHSVSVLGYDKRLAQLVTESVRFHDAYKDVRYTPDLVRKRFGVGPEHLAEWLALVGDRYHLPGIKGIGQKGATALLSEHGSLEAAYAASTSLPGRSGRALRTAGPQVLVELERAILDTTAPDLPLPPWSPPSRAELNAQYATLGFFQLLTSTPSPTRGPVCRTLDAVRAFLASGTPTAVWGLTAEPSPARGVLVGVALTGPSGSTFVPADLLHELASWLADAQAPKIGHDIKATTVALRRRGLDLKGIRGDTALASHLIDPSGMAPHELGPLVRVHLERALPSANAILGTGAKRSTWCEQSIESCASFAVAHVEASWDLWRYFEDAGLRGPLLDEALRLSDVLVRMELAGMPVDATELTRAGEDFAQQRTILEHQIYELAGGPFTINSTKQLGAVLFDELGLEVVSRTKTGWSTANHALERIAHTHPIVELVIRWRRLRRLSDSWITALLTCIEPDGRVRSSFHPARSFTGRLVNSHPDLGRVPGRTHTMARIRRAFRVRDGWRLLSIDYDQLGLYVLAHLSGDPHLVGPLERGEDIHTATACAVLDVSSVTPEQRQIGKVVNFATFAGQGASSLALQLGIGVADAKQLIERFDSRYSGVRTFQERQLALARSTGSIHTLAGRKWPIGDLNSRDPQILGYAERLARRATHEASVADVTRRGLTLAAEALREAGLQAVPLLQIHDEILFEVPVEEVRPAMDLASTAMRTAYALRVPLEVSFKIGDNWADLAAVTR